MKSLVSYILLIAFITTGVFGIFFIAEKPITDAPTFCMAEMIKGFACKTTETVSHASFHLDAASFFSTAIFGSTVSTILTLITLFMLALFARMPQLFALAPRPFFGRNEGSLVSHNAVEPLLSWVSLHENSPSL